MAFHFGLTSSVGGSTLLNWKAALHTSGHCEHTVSSPALLSLMLTCCCVGLLFVCLFIARVNVEELKTFMPLLDLLIWPPMVLAFHYSVLTS